MSSKVSVIVPIYNAEKFLNQTLESLVNQTLNEIDIICINDGSTDSSQSIIDLFKHKYPNKIRSFSKENGGIADTRNYGLSKVISPYFGFVDSDDVVEINMFESLYNSAVMHQSDVVFSNFYWTYPDYEKESKDGPFSSNKEIIIKMFATLWNKIYRTDFINELEVYFPTGYRYEDASFLYKVSPYIKTWSFVDEAFVHYRQTIGSITHNHNDRVKDMIFVFNDLLKFYQGRNLFDTYKVELEFLFIRFFLGNSFLRTCQIKDTNDRKKTLELSYQILSENFPSWKRNPYLKQGGLKNKYFKTVNKWTYPLYAAIFTLIYRFKKEKLS
jgi:glycosyltransferase involved in cell wall biosynthesis